MSDQARQVFFSYAWGGESERIVNELDAALQARGVAIVRDKRDLGYKGVIRDFMEDIGRGMAVVVVISDKYLTSPNCMFELVEVVKNKGLQDRIFPIVLADAEIYDPAASLKYPMHWQEKMAELNAKMNAMGNQANLQQQREAIDDYDAFRDHVSRLTLLLKNMNTLSPAMLESTGFASLIAALETHLKAGAAAAPAAPAAPAAATFAATAVATPQAGAGVDAAAYLADITQRLTTDGYVPMKGERFGPLRFKLAFDKLVKGFLGSDHFRVLVLEEPALTPQRFTALHEQVWAYAKEQNDKYFQTMIFTCLVVTPALGDEVKDLIYQTQPPKLPFGPTFLAAMVVYSAAEKDVFFPTQLAEELDANFEENIKKYLMP